MREGRLITAGCTASWLDWIHSELWMCPDGLLLIKLDLATTRAHGLGPTVASPPVTRGFDDEQIAEAVAKHRRNAWIAADQIRGADLRRGRRVDRLTLSLADGHQRKVLWLPSDRAHEPLVAWLATHGIAASA